MVAVPLDPLLLSEIALGGVALYTLVTAASKAIDSLLALARSYHVPESLIGLTIVAVGTSLPELSAHVTASAGIVSGVLDYEVTSAVVLGGNMGSSTTQQLLLFGILLLGYGQIELSTRTLRDTFAPMALGLLLTLALAMDGTVGRLDGVILLVAFVVYVGFSYVRREQSAPEGTPSANVPKDAGKAVLMLGLVLASASILLAVIQDVTAGVLLGGSMIGVLTLGIASSFPEFSTVLDGMRRKTPVIAIGTLIGSNIVNPLIGFGLGGVVSTYYVPDAVIVWDLPFKILAIGVLALYVYYRDGVLTRRMGVTMVGFYFVYIVGRMLLFPGQ
jgi:cation:H+ antiporter